MKANRLKIIASGSPLAQRLCLRYLEVKFEDRLEACVWTYEEFNRVVGELAANRGLDILKEGVPLLVAEQNSGLRQDLGEVMALIASFEIGPSRKRRRRYQFRLVPKKRNEDQCGEFFGAGLPEQSFSSLYGALVLIDLATEEHDLDPDVAIRLLQAAVYSGLPLYSPEDSVFAEREASEEDESKSSSAATSPALNLETPVWFGLTLSLPGPPKLN